MRSIPIRTTIVILVLFLLCSCNRRYAGLDEYHEALALVDQGDAPSALKKLEAAGRLARTDSLRALVESQKGTLYFSQRMLDRSLQCYKRAYVIDSVARDTVGLIYDLRDIGNVYRAFPGSEERGVRREDSCLACFEKARQLAIATHNQPMQRDVESQLAAYHLYRNHLDEARRLLMPAMKYLNDDNQSGLLFMMADYYHRSGQRDSATLFYEQLLGKGTLYARRSAHRALAEYALTDGHTEEAMHHLQRYEELTDSAHAASDAEALRRMSALYDYSQVQQQAADYHTRLVVAVAVVLLLSGLFVFFILYGRRKRDIYRIRLQRLEQLLEKAKRGYDYRGYEGTGVRGYDYRGYEGSEVRGYENSLVEGEEGNLAPPHPRTSAPSKNHVAPPHPRTSAPSKNHLAPPHPHTAPPPVFQKMERLLNDTRQDPFTDDDFHELESAIEQNYPGFLLRLQDFCRLSPQERRVCLLLKAEVAPAAIAQLTAHSKQSVTNTRSRLFRKAFGRSGTPAEWDEFVHSL